MTTKKEKQTMSLQVTEGLTVTILPDSNHEFLMPSKQVSIGYDVGIDTIRRHKSDHQDELVEGKHFISSVSIPHAASPGASHGTMWTKRGIVRLGFFIKSERAKLFRDWAEDLVINTMPKHQAAEEYPGLYHLVGKAAEKCGSKAALAKRLGLSAAVFTHIYRHPHWLSDEMMRTIEIGCRNILARQETDMEAIGALVMVEDQDARLMLFNKMKKGGLI